MTTEQQESPTQTTDSAVENVNDSQADNGLFSEVNETQETKTEETKPEAEAGDSLLAKVDETPDESKVSDTEKTEDMEAEESAETIEYDLKLPEDSYIDDNVLAEVKEFAEANKLSSEAAQEIVERENRAIEGALQSVMDENNALTETNRQALLSHPELGGENLKETDQLATSVLKRFDKSGEIQAMLEEGGQNFNPAVVGFLVEIGKASAPDTLHLGGSRGPAGDSRQEAAEVLFPLDKL